MSEILGNRVYTKLLSFLLYCPNGIPYFSINDAFKCKPIEQAILKKVIVKWKYGVKYPVEQRTWENDDLMLYFTLNSWFADVETYYFNLLVANDDDEKLNFVAGIPSIDITMHRHEPGPSNITWCKELWEISQWRLTFIFNLIFKFYY